jgi:hypothetical protein
LSQCFNKAVTSIEDEEKALGEDRGLDEDEDKVLDPKKEEGKSQSVKNEAS